MQTRENRRFDFFFFDRWCWKWCVQCQEMNDKAAFPVVIFNQHWSATKWYLLKLAIIIFQIKCPVINQSVYQYQCNTGVKAFCCCCSNLSLYVGSGVLGENGVEWTRKGELWQNPRKFQSFHFFPVFSRWKIPGESPACSPPPHHPHPPDDQVGQGTELNLKVILTYSWL